ncbi:hypothetical protein [Aestuariispira insulae]|uniref:Lipoprotein n=1 Tax=Aestuariispira insulae TaxID=1461337 RepID=A0A3D9HRD7_9PROT|nr:hypothetical protein [Aestuariispira insulae]RED52052.1 hypothetical protein DFP90_10269 [Aestuariispira insulae]
MKFKPMALSIALAGLLSACVTAKPVENSRGLEDLVSCRTQTAAAVDFELEANRESFARPDEEAGNFRIPNDPLFAFGQRVRFFGFKGVGQAAGPNMFLEAETATVKPLLEERLGQALTYNEEHERYYHAIKDKSGRRTLGFVMLFEEKEQGLAVVMCAIVPRY